MPHTELLNRLDSLIALAEPFSTLDLSLANLRSEIAAAAIALQEEDAFERMYQDWQTFHDSLECAGRW